MTIKTLHDLFIHDLSDINSAEKQLSKALPKMARAATSPDLKLAFETHLEETHGRRMRFAPLPVAVEVALFIHRQCVVGDG
ncbi:MAG: ferritin-like domain-containing protein, partial [Alcaligenaceae bacterium]